MSIVKAIEATVKCVKCDALYGCCNCWEKCECGWLHGKGEYCGNPECTASEDFQD